MAAACASSPPPPPKVAPPTDPFDLELPSEAPDPNALARLPELWQQEPARSMFRLDTGPLTGAGNFNDVDGPLSSQYIRNSYLVSEDNDGDRRLVTRLPSESARAVQEEANKAFTAGRYDEALASYLQVIERDPLFAKPYFYVAEIKSQHHDLEAATAWNDRGLRLSPRDAYGYALRAEILLTMGRDEEARGALAYALALDPFSPRGIKLLKKLGGTRMPGIEPPIYIKRPPDQKGVLIARGGGHEAWRRYALCRALLTYDARIRAEFVQSPVQERWPGTRSLEEETACGYLATAVYRGPRRADADKTKGAAAERGQAEAHAEAKAPDPDLERWSQAYDANLLREAIIYETVGCRRPDVLPLLPDEALGRMIEYVRLFVLPRPAAAGGRTAASP